MSKLLTTEDFRKFAKSNNVSMPVFDDVIKHTTNTLTPMIMEESSKNYGVFDIYSKMLCDRIIFFGHEFNSDTCNVAIAELLYLDTLNNNDINIYVNSPGGSVASGLALLDTMNFIKSDIATTCVGVAASMGAVLLSSGSKGKRFALPHSRIMIHQVSSAMGYSTYSDMQIELEQTKRYRDDLYNILANNMGKTFEEVEKLCDRNNWYVGDEAVEIGLIDKVVRN